MKVVGTLSDSEVSEVDGGAILDARIVQAEGDEACGRLSLVALFDCFLGRIGREPVFRRLMVYHGVDHIEYDLRKSRSLVVGDIAGSLIVWVWL